MKKILVIALVVVLALSVVAFAACSGKEYEGEYSYANAWTPGESYGCKVKVRIQGDVITAVEVLEDTATFYNLSAGWTMAPAGERGEQYPDTAGKTNWRLHGDEMAQSFVGLTTAQVLKIKVYVSSTANKDQPITSGGIETIKYLPEQVNAVIGSNEEYKNAGATQSSSRLILAIQNAVLKSQGKSGDAACAAVYIDPGQTVTGEFKYNSYGHTYGAKVDVTVKNGKIVSVRLYSDDETGWVRTSDDNPEWGWVEGSKARVEGEYDAFLAKFQGKTVAEIMAIKVLPDGAEDNAVGSGQLTAAEGKTVLFGGDATWAIAQGTQSSARVVLAIQNALAKIK